MTVRHVFRCVLRWSDMDAFGHINNVTFLRYLEEARIDLMFRLAREAGEAGGGAPGEVPFTGGSVVARHQIDYLRPLTHRHEPVTVETWVTRMGGASATIAYEIKDADAVYVRASTVVVPYDLEKGRPRRLSAVERAFLAHYLDAGDAGDAGNAGAGGNDEGARDSRDARDAGRDSADRRDRAVDVPGGVTAA